MKSKRIIRRQIKSNDYVIVQSRIEPLLDRMLKQSAKKQCVSISKYVADSIYEKLLKEGKTVND